MDCMAGGLAVGSSRALSGFADAWSMSVVSAVVAMLVILAMCSDLSRSSRRVLPASCGQRHLAQRLGCWVAGRHVGMRR